MKAKYTVKLTANFERNLDEIESFLEEFDAPGSFDTLLDDLTDVVIPNLIHFPKIGRSFLERPAGSLETTNSLRNLEKKFRSILRHADLREYVMTDYILLYTQLEDTIHLLSIRHQRQLSFDFTALWAMPR